MLVAPGNVHTAMTATMSTTAKMALNALPIPTKYGQECLMAPEEIAEVMVFLASDSARGVNGNIMFVDGELHRRIIKHRESILIKEGIKHDSN